MSGQKLLSTTLKINAGFSMLSGLDFILFDKTIARVIFGSEIASLAPVGIMLIGFSVFVFAVSTLRSVNKYLVSAIILSDITWVIGSAVLLVLGYTAFTTIGVLLTALIAFVIATFAYFQTKGLRLHLNAQAA